MVDTALITTANALEGYRIVKQMGIIRGITVRSRSVFGNFGGKVQSLFGGQLSLFVELCEKAREEAFYKMVDHGITEVLCYGTAVVVEKL